MRRLLTGAMTVSALAFTACGLFDAPRSPATPQPPNTNVLRDGGFEEENGAWAAKQQPEWAGFVVDGDVVHSGQRALALHLRSDAQSAPTRIAGAYQTTMPSAFPEYVSGLYRVDEWAPGTPPQYIQVVAIVHGGDFGDGIEPHEIRFVLAGIDREPFTLSNAKFLFLSRDPPPLHQWTWFGYPLGQAFLSRWGKLPTRWDSIELFFEVRYDRRPPSAPAAAADVYFDDLYAGPLAGNPNWPPGFLQDP